MRLRMHACICTRIIQVGVLLMRLTPYIYIYFFFLSEDGLQLQISNITISVTTVVFKNDILLENILK
jgi:hypothetical protein